MYHSKISGLGFYVPENIVTNDDLSKIIDTNDDWIMIATFSDTADLRQHIHDTAIDGTGLIVSIFQDAGFYDSIFTSTEIAGFYDSEYWNNSYDGGSPLDNFS